MTTLTPARRCPPHHYVLGAPGLHGVVEGTCTRCKATRTFDPERKPESWNNRRKEQQS